ncbi:hypothetical protein P8610_05015 [Fictibacillus sp. UD]
MLTKVLHFLPDWIVFVQSLVCFIVPIGIAKFFKWINSLEKV